MARKRWHTTTEAGAVTLSRKRHARFDVLVETNMPVGRPLRLAHQIRQDIWRALQSVRGLAPVVEVIPCETGLRVRVGGEIAAKRFPRAWIESVLSDVVSDPENRMRWARYSAVRGGKT